MAVKIPGKKLDDRVAQILRDPKAYFAAAREQARADVRAERQRPPRLVRRTA